MQCIMLLRHGLQQTVRPGGPAQWRLARMWAAAWTAYGELATCRLLLLVLPEGPGRARAGGELDGLVAERMAEMPIRALQPIAGLQQEAAQV